MASYAADTSVSSERSRGEIEKTLTRYGATKFMYGYDETRALVQFETKSRQVRFELPMPNRRDRQFTHTPTRDTPRTATAAAEAYEQAVRQRWRALNLVIKAKLEAVESGIVGFDAEFMAHIVLPNGATVGEVMVPGIADAYEFGVMPPLLPSFKAIEA